MTWDPTDASQTTPKVVQTNDYYAFGYTIQSLQSTISPKNEYLYNGKELQEQTGLYDYGARSYDPGNREMDKYGSAGQKIAEDLILILTVTIIL